MEEDHLLGGADAPRSPQIHRDSKDYAKYVGSEAHQKWRAAAADAGPGEEAEVADEETMRVEWLYKTGSYLRPIFGEAAAGRGGTDKLFGAAEVRAHLEAYVAQEGLAAEGGGLRLDKLLKGGLYNKTEPQEVGDAEGFEDVLDRLLGKLARHHKLTRALPSGGEVQTVGKGEIKKISMMAEDRHIGRKFITRIVNLEQYGIDPEEFASTMQKKFQAGFQIVKAPGANAGKQIEFQGKVMRELIDYLGQKEGIPRKHVEVTGKVPL